MFEKLRFLKILVMKIFFDFSRQCKCHQFYDIEIKIPIHKRLVIALLKDMAKRTSLGLIGFKLKKTSFYDIIVKLC